jgi:hypothetical protein
VGVLEPGTHVPEQRAAQIAELVEHARARELVVSRLRDRLGEKPLDLLEVLALQTRPPDERLDTPRPGLEPFDDAVH